MTISSISNKVQFNGSGSTGPFPFSFKVFSAGDLTVVKTDSAGVETTLALTTGYTVTLNGDQNNNPGGSVTTTEAVASGYKLTLVREVDFTQETDITNGGGFYPEVVENALDRLTMLVQQVEEKANRAVKIPVSSNETPANPEDIVGYAISAEADAGIAAASAASATASASAAAASALSAQVAEINWRGAWDSGTAYALRDAVGCNGASYICISAHSNQVPPNATFWDVLALRGVDGASGNGTGDVTGQASSVDNELVLFSGTNGKSIKRSGSTGIVKVTSGVVATATGSDVVTLINGVAQDYGSIV